MQMTDNQRVIVRYGGRKLVTVDGKDAVFGPRLRRLKRQVCEISRKCAIMIPAHHNYLGEFADFQQQLSDEVPLRSARLRRVHQIA